MVINNHQQLILRHPRSTTPTSPSASASTFAYFTTNQDNDITTTLCDTPDKTPLHTTTTNNTTNTTNNNKTGTQSRTSAIINLAKCICGAGSFALPHVFLEEGVLGGTLALTTCGILAIVTMQSLAQSTVIASRMKQRRRNKLVLSGSGGSIGGGGEEVTSYVELAELALNRQAANVVFLLTLIASLGVCSTYLVFIGQTLSSLSNDTTSTNILRRTLPDIPTRSWELWTILLLYPLSLLRDYGIFKFTSALGVIAVLGGIGVTLASGIYVHPGGGIRVALSSIGSMPLWPTSFAQAFGSSFGTIAYLFYINFLTFPIRNSMEDKSEYHGAVGIAVAGVWGVNLVFAVLCLGFYGEETEDLVLGNLENGIYLSCLKLLLCVDLGFTFPIVLSSGRQILEDKLLGTTELSSLLVGGGVGRVVLDGDRKEGVGGDDNDSLVPLVLLQQQVDGTTTPTTTTTSTTTATTTLLSLQRAAIVAIALTACFTLAQIGGFGAVANLVGGVAQGTLAFIMPPAIAISLARKNEDVELSVGGEVCQFLLMGFGVVVVSLVTYFTAVGILSG